MQHTTQEVGAPVGVDFMSIRSPSRAKSTNVISFSYDDVNRENVKNYILDGQKCYHHYGRHRNSLTFAPDYRKCSKCTMLNIV